MCVDLVPIALATYKGVPSGNQPPWTALSGKSIPKPELWGTHTAKQEGWMSRYSILFVILLLTPLYAEYSFKLFVYSFPGITAPSMLPRASSWLGPLITIPQVGRVPGNSTHRMHWPRETVSFTYLSMVNYVSGCAKVQKLGNNRQ